MLTEKIVTGRCAKCMVPTVQPYGEFMEGMVESNRIAISQDKDGIVILCDNCTLKQIEESDGTERAS
jgi:hypothetical protein